MRRRWWRAIFVVVCVTSVFWACSQPPLAGATPVLSGGTTLNIAVRPVPGTLDPPHLDTPTEWTLFVWNVDTAINLKCSFNNMAFLVSSVFGIAGVQYVAPGAEFRLGDHFFKGTLLFATPFESVTDKYNLPNAAVIPYGDFLFAGVTLEATLRFGISTVRWTSVLQDLNFPSPGARYDPPGWPDGEPKFYGLEHQQFEFGSMITLSTRIADTLPLSVQIGLGAGPGSISVKGYSLSGRADPGRLFMNVFVSGIKLPCSWCDGPVGEPTIGVSARFEPWSETFWSLTGSVSLVMFELARLGTSFSLSNTGVNWGGISVHIPHTLGTLSVQLDTSGGISSATLGWSYRHQFIFGRTRGTCGFTGSWVTDRGVIAMSYNLALNQALFSSSYGLSYAWRSDIGLAFSALRLRFTMNLSPVQISVPLVFGRGGLSSFGISAGYVF